MKGIENCAECAYYSMKTHKCSRGAKIEPELANGDDVRFFADCPLCEAEPVRHGHWIIHGGDMWCSECEYEDVTEYGEPEDYHYCPHCGARMDGDAE